VSVRAADGHLCPDDCRPELVAPVVTREGHGYRFEISRRRITAVVDRDHDLWLSAPEGESMEVPCDAIPDLIAVLRVAQDVWTRYARPAGTGSASS
jgi:hypothetical protein